MEVTGTSAYHQGCSPSFDSEVLQQTTRHLERHCIHSYSETGSPSDLASQVIRITTELFH